MSSPEQSSHFEPFGREFEPQLLPQLERFREMVEFILDEYGWASEEVGEAEFTAYGTTFKADIIFDKSPATLRCGILNIGKSFAHRLVLTWRGKELDFDLAEQDSVLTMRRKDLTDPKETRCKEFDDAKLKILLDHLTLSLLQLDYDWQFEELVLPLINEKAAETKSFLRFAESQFDTPSN